MNESMWLELAKQVPSLCVLVTLVVLFLRHLAREGETNRQSWHQHNMATNSAIQTQASAMQKLTDAIVDLRIDHHQPRQRNDVNNF